MNKIFVKKQVYESLEKAFGHKDIGKLTKKVVTDKNGKQRTVYVKNGEDPKKQKKGKLTEEEKIGSHKSKSPIISGSDKYEIGDFVTFNYGGNTLSGEIITKGPIGVKVKDKDGNEYKVKFDAITGISKKSNGSIPSESFNANDYKSQYTDKQATPDTAGKLFIYDSLLKDKNYDPKVIEKAIDLTKLYLDEQDKRIAKKGDTDQRYTGGLGVEKSKSYSLERQKLHDKILSDMFTPEKIKACQPAPGEQPKFIMFGGRGGSGKGWFTDKKRAAASGREVMFDSDKFLTLDADAIKELLPEFEGWNAGEVHEESSYLMKKAKAMAESYGMNIIIDGTMAYSNKNPNKVRNEMLHFKDKGYRVEAHYMFLPVQESSKRAIMRFAHKDKKTGNYDFKGRLVPMNILLGMQDNEKSFDSVKDICDDWSFRDNNVPMGEEPKLISQKGK